MFLSNLVLDLNWRKILLFFSIVERRQKKKRKKKKLCHSEMGLEYVIDLDEKLMGVRTRLHVGKEYSWVHVIN